MSAASEDDSYDSEGYGDEEDEEAEEEEEEAEEAEEGDDKEAEYSGGEQENNT